LADALVVAVVVGVAAVFDADFSLAADFAADFTADLAADIEPAAAALPPDASPRARAAAAGKPRLAGT
jgi:hypothetical protein